ncbi:MAG: hypothetical protein HUJ68_07510 [Clostridia bacterium]|nr:hypothetical protein [Clostridia bacterium]
MKKVYLIFQDDENGHTLLKVFEDKASAKAEADRLRHNYYSTDEGYTDDSVDFVVEGWEVE